MSLRYPSRYPSIVSLITLTAIIFLSACSLAQTPEQRAQEFWDALAEGNLEKAKSLTVSNTLGRLPGEDNLKQLSTRILPTEQTSEQANTLKLTTEQTVTTQDGLNVSYQFTTHMLKRDDTWQVDLESTKPELAAAAIKATFNQLTTTLGASAENLSQALGQSLNSELQTLGQFLNQAVNEGLTEAGGELAKMADELERVAREHQYIFHNHQTSQAQSDSTNANVQGIIDGQTLYLNKAYLSQNLILSSDTSQANVSIFFFNNELNDPLTNSLAFTGSEDNAPHLHLYWKNSNSGKPIQKIITDNYQLSMSAHQPGHISLSLVIPSINAQLSGQLTIQN